MKKFIIVGLLSCFATTGLIAQQEDRVPPTTENIQASLNKEFNKRISWYLEDSGYGGNITNFSYIKVYMEYQQANVEFVLMWSCPGIIDTWYDYTCTVGRVNSSLLMVGSCDISVTQGTGSPSLKQTLEKYQKSNIVPLKEDESHTILWDVPLVRAN